MKGFGIFLVAAIVLLPTLASLGDDSRAPGEQMTEDAAAGELALYSMKREQVQALINSAGFSCPLITVAEWSTFSGGAHYWFIACSDGSRFTVYYAPDIGRIAVVRRGGG